MSKGSNARGIGRDGGWCASGPPKPSNVMARVIRGARCLWLWGSGGRCPQALQAAKQWSRLGVDVRHKQWVRYRGAPGEMGGGAHRDLTHTTPRLSLPNPKHETAITGRGTTRAEDAQGAPTLSHIPPSKLVYDNKPQTANSKYQNPNPMPHKQVYVTWGRDGVCWSTEPRTSNPKLLTPNPKLSTRCA